MKREDTLPLNAQRLAARVEELGLKQWWLAEQLGVDRKTVGRWLSGKVRRIARDNLARLAAELGCSEGDLLLEDGEALATREERRAAAEALRERDLLQLLAPTDDWPLAESLIKATLGPHLPLRSLGQLRNLLSVACWRQGHYEEALVHAGHAREIGERIGERGIVLKATLNQATIHSFVGPIPLAVEEYAACLREPEAFDSQRDHGAALSNVGWLHREERRFDEACEAQLASIRIFSALGLDYNLAISWISLTLHHTELGAFESASEALRTARRHADAARYERGRLACRFYEADIRGLQGEHARAVELVRAALPEVARFQAFDLTCREIAVRQLRLAGELEAAEEELASALRLSRTLPLIQASTLVEGSRLARARGRERLERERRERANAIYRETGLDVRTSARPWGEHGTREPSRRPG